MIRNQYSFPSSHDLETLESDIGIKLPHDVRAFLLSYDHDVSDLDCIEVSVIDHPQSPTDVQLFLPVVDDVESVTIRWQHENKLVPSGYGDLIPIAMDSMGCLFCVDPEKKRVVYLDFTKKVVDEYLVASSFSEFLKSITVQAKRSSR